MIENINILITMVTRNKKVDLSLMTDRNERKVGLSNRESLLKRVENK